MVDERGRASGGDPELGLELLDAPTPARTWPAAFWIAVCALVIGFLTMQWAGPAEAETFLLLLVLAFGIGLIARSMSTPLDGTWIPSLIIWAWVVKIMASAARYLALELLYGGSGDATGYHGKGIQYAPLWRSFNPPELGTETEFVQGITGLIYAPYTPTKLGGFFIFATIAFVGQVLLYAAFRRAFPSRRVKWYAALIFFFPNILYWPSSIGKEALMLFFIGCGAYASVRLFSEFRLRWLLLLGFGLAGCGVIRSHIALLLALSLVGALVLGRGTAANSNRGIRLITLFVVVLISAFVVRYALEDFGIDLSGGISDSLVDEELDPIFSNVEDQTDKGGSAVEGSAIRSPADVPEAVIRVIFRPLPTDAHNVQALANSIVEGLFLLLLFIWRGPAIIRNLIRHWRDPYILFSLLYTAGFVFGHSAVLNLGIIARQRSQAIPFILVLLVELGKKPEPRGDRLPAPDAGDTPEEQASWPAQREPARVPEQELGASP